MNSVNLNDILFNVEKFEVNAKAVSAQKYRIIGWLDGENEEPTILNNCSNKYFLLKNIDIFPVIETTLNLGNCEYEKIYEANEEMTVFHATYIIKKINGIDVGIDLGNGDVIYFTINQGNSYNGYKNGQMNAGFFRVICSNGLVIPYEGTEEMNFNLVGRHTQKLSLSFDNLMDSIENFIAMQDVFVKRFKVLTDRFVPNYADRIEEVLNATKLKPSNSQLEVIKETIQIEANELYNGKINDWLIYNGINAYIFKGVDSNGQTSKAFNDVKTKSDQKVLSYILAN